MEPDTGILTAGHGGAEGKRCAYFVDERYLASLGLMTLEISSRIPMQPSPAKPWKLALLFPMQLSPAKPWKLVLQPVGGLPRETLKISPIEKIFFGPPVKSNRYFFKLPKRMPHRTYLAESGAKRPTNDFSRSVTAAYGRTSGKMKIQLWGCGLSSESAPTAR